jgi:hypothetical protein
VAQDDYYAPLRLKIIPRLVFTYHHEALVIYTRFSSLWACFCPALDTLGSFQQTSKNVSSKGFEDFLLVAALYPAA